MPKMVTISYVPLFYPQWPLCEVNTKRQQRKLYSSIKKFLSGPGFGQATACVWFGNDKHSGHTPAFVLPRGRDIFKHINWWSQDKPEEFFQFFMHYDPIEQWYNCVLTPNLTKSQSRLTFNLEEIGVDADAAASLLYVPLSFRAAPASRTCKKILDAGGTFPSPGDTIDIGILDDALVNTTGDMGPGTFDPHEVNWLRNIPVIEAEDHFKRQLAE